MARARAPEEALTPARLGIVLVLAATFVVMGCGKDPVKPEPAKPFVYPDRSTPDNTLRRMTFAFANRDTGVTASVYADDYEGTSTDMVYSPTTLTFTRADEVKVVEAMAGSSITTIGCDFYSPATWVHTHYSADPVGWVTIQVPDYNIYLYDSVRGEFQTRSPSSGMIHFFEFTLKPTTPDATSPTDTTWTIVRWKEIVDNT